MSLIATYEDVVPMSRVLDYLRFDVQDTIINDEVSLMRDAACRCVEQYSNYYLKPTEKTYAFLNGKADVYAFPINDDAIPLNDEPTHSIIYKGLYRTYQNGHIDKMLTLNVGYKDTDDVEPILIQAVLETVRVWFYNSEGETEGLRLLPITAKSMLKPIKRFVF